MFYKFVKDTKFGQIINKFYKCKIYILSIGLLVLLSSLFGFEIPVFYITAIYCGLIPVLFCGDMTSVVTPLMMYYCTFSLKHNNTEIGISVFNDKQFLYQLIGIASFIGVILITRLFFDIFSKKFKYTFPRLTIGFAVLGISMLLSGLISPYFESKSLLIGALEICSLSLVYFYLFFTIDWNNFKLDYVFFSMIVFGFVLLIETAGTYYITKDLDYLVGKGKVLIGWGRRTNMGGMSCLLISAPFYYILKNKYVILNSIISILFLGSVIITQARGPATIAILIYILCLIILLIKVKRNIRNKFLITAFMSFAVFYGVSRLFGVYPFQISNSFISNFFDESASIRFDTWKDGFQKFAKYPFLGTGWYSCNHIKFTITFFPARWHSTIVQLLATGGIVLTIAYLYHRFETVWLLFRTNKRVPLNKAFLFIPILALIFSSMLDCFMFNLGPGLIYGVLLVSIEKGENDKAVLFSKEKVPSIS